MARVIRKAGEQRCHSSMDHDRLELIKDGNHYFEFLNEDLTRITQSPAPQEFNGAA